MTDLPPTAAPEIAAATAAAETAGISAAGARLISHSSNAIVVLPATPAVARVTTGPGSLRRVARMQALARWLVDHGHPATEPLPGVDVINVDEATVVSFWVYYPQPPEPDGLDSEQLATLLRHLHDVGPVPVDLPQWTPLESLAAVAADRHLSRALTASGRSWLLDRITEVRHEVATLDWPLGRGLIHGDAWAGNLLWDSRRPTAGVILGDWDWASYGPREVDLIPTWHATVRYGRPSSWSTAFVQAYGYDLAGWAGYDVLLQMRDLVQLTGPLRRAPTSDAAAGRLAQRLGDLRRGDRTASWQARP